METPLPLAFNQRFVICENPNCEYLDQKRVASFPLIGTELYCEGVIRCKCGNRSTIVKE